VTASQAEETLKDFLDNRLNQFGDYQDAMWMNQPWLYHSRLAAAMNLHILHPLKVITQAEDYFKSGKAPLAAVEGFIRQILGWREYVRGIYWLYMPQYLERNTLNANHDLPAFFWTANTDLNCLNQAIGQTLKHGYAHHIQRLMITGLFCLLYGVKPTQVHEWYLAVYVDAVEWVELPNSLGMSQYADGGVMASKPYIASGKYIDRMGNYCKKCKYDPAKSVGEDACPFTTMYWDFLMRHEKLLSSNPRMGMQVRNLNRLSDNTKEDIKSQANAFRLSLKMI
ncbi:MAG: cryptochrome/photolyase family protein, partial [Gemmataceae bacterium]|nr:cryptochrome/photolyase family protein [Gemmataceae bacterium]